MFTNRFSWPLLALVFLSSNRATAQQETRIKFTDISDRCGIQFVHSDGGTGLRTVVESVVGGFATLDFDDDGFVDIFFVNGMPLGGDGNAKPTYPALYRNNGDFTFSDVTQQAGIGKSSYGMGAVAADYDEDGDTDLYVSNFGKNFLYQNNGDGTFTDVTEVARVALPEKVGAGCAFLDIENDGDLDLYVGSYVQFSLDKHVPKMIGKYGFHPGPTDFPPSPDALFRNDGDGTFTDISASAGILSQASYSMGVIAFDADEDSDIDIFMGNDQRPNTLWINDGKGNFVDQALIAGVAFDRMGKADGNMAVEIGDVNGDGLLDILTTTYQDEMPVLYKNMGNGQFLDQTNVFQIDRRLLPHVKWGCGLFDFDHDSDLDIFIACGHFMDNIQYIDDRTTVKVRDFLLENRSGKFVNVTGNAGSGLEIVESSRGAAFDDFDNDGDIDIVVLNANARPSVLRNDSNVHSRGLAIRLIGVRSNRSALGAKIQIISASKTQVRQLVAGRGYQSQYAAVQHVGLANDALDHLLVTWPSGISERFSMLTISETMLIQEGKGQEIITPSKAP